MKRSGLSSTLVLLCCSQVWAMDGKGSVIDHFTIGSSLGTAALSESTSHPRSSSETARDDALAYVATNGRLCGPRLQQALRDYRQAHPQSTVSDAALAAAIASQG
ncbi:hypothetical protein KMS_R20800 [Pseudomonas sp. LRP2-20]|uniref:DUF2388 domain-containing protein n=1 Tax=Pseudomonas sp. LRP2-20 TaxID=2944234 RepID=UPI0021849E09|nr:DUF2388 domain-containing protein [Pseudomonas sp. LRP2-20]BDM22323.1 hypothetical protein KMS_R20800 [Pseudomonas sp. LRP2-20]